MKLKFLLLLCSTSVQLMSAWTSAAASSSIDNTLPTELNDLPIELIPLKAELASIYQHFRSADPTHGRMLESEASRNAQKQRWLPVFALQSTVDRSEQKFFANGAEINSTAPQTNLQYGFNIKQNLFSGGQDLKKGEMLKLSETAAQLRHQLAWKTTAKNWILDAIQIQFYRELVAFSEEAHQQALQLNRLAQRKEASGFLGKRDLLESEREVLRTSEELQKNKSNLLQLTQTSFLRYGARNDPLSKNKVLAPLLRVSDSLISLPTTQIVDTQAPQSLPWRIAQTEMKIAEQDISRARFTRFAPSIDASAGFTESKELDAKGSATSTTTNADKSQQWSVALSGTLQLNPPLTFGAVEEARQRLLTARQNETREQREVSLSLSSSIERLRIVLERLKVTTKLVEATTKIREQNQRLFEAGEISLDRVILSQQELDRDRKILVTLTNEENLLRAEMGLSTLWSLPPNSSSAAGL